MSEQFEVEPKTQIGTLVSKQVSKQLSQRSDQKGLVQLLGHLSFLCLTAFSISAVEPGWLFFVALLVHGIVLSFVFSPLHETIHYTAFKSIEMNNTVAAVFGFILVIPYQYFRAYHSAHHRYTQDVNKDPELISKLKGKKRLTRYDHALHLSGLPFWWGNFKTLYQHAKGKVTEADLQKSDLQSIITEARIHTGLYLALIVAYATFDTTWLLHYWVLPLLIGQPFLRWFLLAEHSGCDFSSNMLENSRTTYASPLVNFLSWNMSYHAEHHYLASVPFHALPALHAYTGQQVKFKGDGYWKTVSKIL
jgi:fatty acid desaturase